MSRSGSSAVRRRTRSWQRRYRGIAEIVGTLMLILIVVAAAIALAAFVASYEKQVLAEESQSQQRALESLKILSVTPVLNSTNPSQIASFTFVLASEYINPSQVQSIDLNGQPLKLFWALNVTNLGGTPVKYSAPGTLILTARQEAIITVILAPSYSPDFSLYNDSFVLTTSDYIEISIYTQLQNTFTQVFIPPTAIAFVSDLTTYTAGTPVQVPLLDGTQSFQPGTNASIVQWNWTVFNETSGDYFNCNNGAVSPSPVSCYGSEVELSWLANWPDTESETFLVSLTVTNTDQLSGVVSVTFSYTGSLSS